MRRIEAFRASLVEEAAARGVRLTALAFHVKALARCLTEFPRFNASLTADGGTLIFKRYVHVGVAVDTPHGLMVPVIRDADFKGLWRIAADIAELASRARSRKLRAEEMGGASMSISNLGGIGGTGFTPLVNPPEVAILGAEPRRGHPGLGGGRMGARADGPAGSVLRPPRHQWGRRGAVPHALCSPFVRSAPDVGLRGRLKGAVGS